MFKQKECIITDAKHYAATTDENQLHAYMILFFSSLPTTCGCKRDLDYRQTDKLRVLPSGPPLLTTTERYIIHVTTDAAAKHLSISPES